MVYHGFVRIPSGAFTAFEGPDAAQILPTSINDAGDVTGECGGDGTNHGFVRTPSGALAVFDAPNADNRLGTIALAINKTGSITGYVWDNGYGSWRGFVRSPSGTFTVFDAPDATATYANSINDGCDITGYYVDASNVYHGFLRTLH